MEPMGVDRFFEHNGQDIFRCEEQERNEDMTTKTHRLVNIKEEIQNLRLFRQHINARSEWVFSHAWKGV